MKLRKLHVFAIAFVAIVNICQGQHLKSCKIVDRHCKDFTEMMQTDNFPVRERTQTIYFNTKSKGYVVGGNAEDILYQNALWEFDPLKGPMCSFIV
jgi:hypothetical protein